MEHTITTRITVLKHLVAGRDLDFAATVTHLTRDQVSEIATAHGYPKTESMARAIEILEQKTTESSDLTSKSPAPEGRPDRPNTGPRPATTSPSSVTTPDARTVGPPDEIRVLLNTAKAHPAKRIQAAANRVFDDIDKLRSLIREDQEKNAERRKAEEAKAAARREVERLEEQLRAAKAKARGATKKPSKPRDPNAAPAGNGKLDEIRTHIAEVLARHEVTAKDVRTWATENNVPCPPVGVLPVRVVDAYDAAHQSTAA